MDAVKRAYLGLPHPRRLQKAFAVVAEQRASGELARTAGAVKSAFFRHGGSKAQVEGWDVAERARLREAVVAKVDEMVEEGARLPQIVAAAERLAPGSRNWVKIARAKNPRNTYRSATSTLTREQEQSLVIMVKAMETARIPQTSTDIGNMAEAAFCISIRDKQRFGLRFVKRFKELIGRRAVERRRGVRRGAARRTGPAVARQKRVLPTCCFVEPSGVACPKVRRSLSRWCSCQFPQCSFAVCGKHSFYDTRRALEEHMAGVHAGPETARAAAASSVAYADDVEETDEGQVDISPVYDLGSALDLEEAGR